MFVTHSVDRQKKKRKRAHNTFTKNNLCQTLIIYLYVFIYVYIFPTKRENVHSVLKSSVYVCYIIKVFPCLFTSSEQLF